MVFQDFTRNAFSYLCINHFYRLTGLGIKNVKQKKQQQKTNIQKKTTNKIFHNISKGHHLIISYNYLSYLRKHILTVY